MRKAPTFNFALIYRLRVALTVLFVGAFLSVSAFAGEVNREASAGRVVRVVNTAAATVVGRQVVVPVQLDSQGGEAVLSFTVNFNPAVLTLVTAAPGNGVPTGTTLTLNTDQAAQGRIGVVLESTSTYAAGSRQILRLTFVTSNTVPFGWFGSSTPITFSSTPTPQSTAGILGESLETKYVVGNIVFIGEPGRSVRAVNTQAVTGFNVTVPIQLDAQGNEATLSFTVNFDPSKLTYVSAAAGVGVPAGTVLSLNTSQAAEGRLGVVLESTNRYNPGTRQLITITFALPANQQPSTIPITFGSAPTPRSVSTELGALLSTFYEPGNVIVSPSAAGVSVSGRVTDAAGRPLRNAVVVLTDMNGDRRIATTGSFGAYAFTDVRAGASYLISVSSKRFRFAPRNVLVTDSVTAVDFAAIE